MAPPSSFSDVRSSFPFLCPTPQSLSRLPSSSTPPQLPTSNSQNRHYLPTHFPFPTQQQSFPFHNAFSPTFPATKQHLIPSNSSLFLCHVPVVAALIVHRRYSWKHRSAHPEPLPALAVLLVPTKPEYRGIRSFRSEFAVTTRCYSAKKGRKSKAEPEVMKQEKEAFYVVRKGDVVGIYNSLADSQAQVGSSVCNPPVSVYKGYSLSKDTEEYLVSHGLKNALYTIRAGDLKEDLFGMLVPCPFQEPSTKEGTSNKDVSKKRSLGVLGQDEKVIFEDPLRKQVKLDHAAVAEAPLHATRTCFVEFDGASKGNPGKAGAGAILRANDGSLICRLREGVGIATNNAAEYRAMILGMKYALKKGFTGIRIQGDSKLVCMQIDGSWKVKNENLSTLYNVAKELKDKFSSFQISHVLRNFNSDADAQANLAINLADGQVQEECV